MKAFASDLGLSALVVTVAWGITMVVPADQKLACDSIDAAVRLADRSRNGIAVSCAQWLSDRARHEAAAAPDAVGAPV